MYSIIIPVFNRPKELEGLLHSLMTKRHGLLYEVIVVDDGSTLTSKLVCERYDADLPLRYYYIEKQGAGMARNYGAKKAVGDYYLMLDSDCIPSVDYLLEVHKALEAHYTDSFAAPDRGHKQIFTDFQNAVNFTLTSRLTTGGIRGNATNKYNHLRGFNMGISKSAFEKVGGFTNREIGEDIELSIKAQKCGVSQQFIPKAYVYHRPKSTLKAFFKQFFAFGAGRYLLTKDYPESRRLIYWFPLFFIITSSLSLLFLLEGFPYLLILHLIYLIIIYIVASHVHNSPRIGLLSVQTTIIQFFAYGLGYIQVLLKKLFN